MSTSEYDIEETDTLIKPGTIALVEKIIKNKRSLSGDFAISAAEATSGVVSVGIKLDIDVLKKDKTLVAELFAVVRRLIRYKEKNPNVDSIANAVVFFKERTDSRDIVQKLQIGVPNAGGTLEEYPESFAVAAHKFFVKPAGVTHQRSVPGSPPPEGSPPRLYQLFFGKAEMPIGNLAEARPHQLPDIELTPSVK